MGSEGDHILNGYNQSNWILVLTWLDQFEGEALNKNPFENNSHWEKVLQQLKLNNGGTLPYMDGVEN